MSTTRMPLSGVKEALHSNKIDENSLRNKPQFASSLARFLAF